MLEADKRVYNKFLRCNMNCTFRSIKCNICIDHDCFEKKQEEP